MGRPSRELCARMRAYVQDRTLADAERENANLRDALVRITVRADTATKGAESAALTLIGDLATAALDGVERP